MLHFFGLSIFGFLLPPKGKTQGSLSESMCMCMCVYACQCLFTGIVCCLESCGHTKCLWMCLLWHSLVFHSRPKPGIPEECNGFPGKKDAPWCSCASNSTWACRVDLDTWLVVVSRSTKTKISLSVNNYWTFLLLRLLQINNSARAS